jgi:hypothetical protein
VWNDDSRQLCEAHRQFDCNCLKLYLLVYRVLIVLTYFTVTLDVNLWRKLMKWYSWSISLYGAKTWTLWNVDQKCLESGAGAGWRRSVGPIVWKISTIKRRTGGLVIWCVGTAFWSTVLKNGRRDQKTSAATGWPWGKDTLREFEKGRTRSDCRKLVFKGAMDQSQDRLCDEYLS